MRSIFAVLLLAGVVNCICGCKKDASIYFINAMVDGVQYNCSSVRGSSAPVYSNPSYSNGNYNITIDNPDSANFEFTIIISRYSYLTGLNFPFSFSTQDTAPGINIGYNSYKTHFDFGLDNTKGLSVTITSISNSMIKGTFSGSFLTVVPGAPASKVENGFFSLPFHP